MTERVHSYKRNIKADELGAFMENDKIQDFSCESFLKALNHSFRTPVLVFSEDQDVILQLTEFVHDISKLIRPNFKYEAFYMGVKCSILSLYSNNIYHLYKWSAIEEVVSYLAVNQESHYVHVMNEYRSSISAFSTVGNIVYTPAKLVRAFEYFAISRSTNQRFRKDHVLPSVKTLTRITLTVKNMDDNVYLDSILRNLTAKQRNVIMMIDQIYVKPRWHCFWLCTEYFR